MREHLSYRALNAASPLRYLPQSFFFSRITDAHCSFGISMNRAIGGRTVYETIVLSPSPASFLGCWRV